MDPLSHKMAKAMAILISCRVPRYDSQYSAWNWCRCNFSCFVARWASVMNKPSSVPTFHQLSYSYRNRYLSVRTCVVNYFTESSKGFRRDAMLQNEHVFCSWIHHAGNFTDLSNWSKHRPSNESDFDPSVMGTITSRAKYCFISTFDPHTFTYTNGKAEDSWRSQ
jgi:hypothetical protein